MTDPMPEAEIEALSEEMQAQREEILATLAEELGGDPADYRAERYFAEADADT